MNFKNLKTPEELMAYMDKNIEYGVINPKTGKLISKNGQINKASWNAWLRYMPDEIINNKFDHCFGQTELEREFFAREGYDFRTILIYFECAPGNNLPMHSYLIFKNKDNDNWSYFEHSDYSNRGIYEFESQEDAVNFQRGKQLAHALENNTHSQDKLVNLSKKIKIIDYTLSQPPYHCSSNEFIKHILKNGKEVILPYLLNSK